MSLDIDVKTAKTGFFHFPKLFYAVLSIEFCERFAFYGFQAVAVLYFTQKFQMTESASSDLFASFSALLYAMLSVGGITGDKFIGIRRTYLLGILFLIVGYGLLSLVQTEHYLYYAIGIILVGNILFKTNANNYVGRCFESNDPRLDSAFTYFYMSINMGSLFSMIIVPIISKVFDYKTGLMLNMISMIVAFVFYIIFKSRFRLADNNTGKNGSNLLIKILIVVVVGSVLAYLLGIMLSHSKLSTIFLYLFAGIVIAIYLFTASRCNHKEAKGMYVALILIAFAILFYLLYMQQATSMTLFALHNVRLNILGFDVPAGVTQALNPFFVVFLSPLLANLYMKLHKDKVNYTIPAKFLTGIFLTGICFITLAIAAQFSADNNSQVSVAWMFLAYAFFSIGELLVSAIGPSMVVQLLPKRFGGFAQGIWFLSSAIGIKTGGQLSSYVAMDTVKDVAPNVILHSYINFFYKLGIVIFIIVMVLSFSVKSLNKAINDITSHKY